jgi:hypothetical protein
MWPLNNNTHTHIHYFILRDGLRGTRLSLKILLHTKTGIEKTLIFLKETGIVTRKWHLERRQEEAAAEQEEEDEAEEAEEVEEEAAEEEEAQEIHNPFLYVLPGRDPQCPLEQIGASFLVFTLQYTYLYLRLVGLKTNRPTIVTDLHRMLKGINKQTNYFILTINHPWESRI